MEELANGKFQTVIGDVDKPVAKNVRRVIVCSGKVYYDLLAHRREQKIADVAVIRLEQQYPFPHADFTAAVAEYPNAAEVVWCQEEPQNQSAWYRLRAYLRADIAENQVLAYAGRPISASPAVGYMSKHLNSKAGRRRCVRRRAWLGRDGTARSDGARERSVKVAPGRSAATDRNG
jgi:2-oxoglutarate dehydrogenase E1 component